MVISFANTLSKKNATDRKHFNTFCKHYEHIFYLLESTEFSSNLAAICSLKQPHPCK
mgnify:CR=1 FL=1